MDWYCTCGHPVYDHAWDDDAECTCTRCTCTGLAVPDDDD